MPIISGNWHTYVQVIVLYHLVFFFHTFSHLLGTQKQKDTHTLTLCISIQPATGRGNAASCGRMGGEAGGHSECTRLCTVCVYVSSVLQIYVWLYNVVPSVISTTLVSVFFYPSQPDSSVDTIGFVWSAKLPLGPDVDTTRCTRFLTSLLPLGYTFVTPTIVTVSQEKWNISDLTHFSVDCFCRD